MNVIVVANYDEMSERAAAFVAAEIGHRPDLRIGLPTGNTPSGMYERLVGMHRRGEVDFSQISTFNLDEYWGIEFAHPAAFARYIGDRFLAHVNVPEEQAHWPDGIGQAEQNAAAYEVLLSKGGPLGLLILGIGVNGHIGFNEPGTNFASRTGLVPLAERTRQDAFHPRSGFDSAEDVPTHGITMGIGTMMESRRILLLASGQSKAQAIKKALAGSVTEDVPASVLQRHPDVTVIVDEAAAALLDAD